MEIKLYDVLTFEDEDSNYYQDCVVSIERGQLFTNADYTNNYFIKLNGFTLYTDLNYNLLDFWYNNFDEWGMDHPETKVCLKEIYRKYKNSFTKVWDKDAAAFYELQQTLDKEIENLTECSIDPDVVKYLNKEE